MDERNDFQKALSDFTFEAAAGGAIRHLADLGYTVRQITERLTYPMPYAKVQRAVWRHLTESGVILTAEPSAELPPGAPAYAVERNRYGRTSFRRETGAAETVLPIDWKCRRFDGRPEELAAELLHRCGGDGERQAYLSWDCGVSGVRDSEDCRRMLEALNGRQREYMEGLPWEDRVCYHRLDGRMREIVVRLYGRGLYHGCCYFTALREKWTLGLENSQV